MSEDNRVPDLSREWMIRPCETYQAEYKDCVSVRARFHQYFVHGKSIDCLPWKRDYDLCRDWKKTKSQATYGELLKNEDNRRAERLKPHYNNNVWKKRDKPPADWNKPLPEWMLQKFEGSYLSHRSNELKQRGYESLQTSGRMCTIL